MVIVGGGPSAGEIDFDQVKEVARQKGIELRWIVINNSVQLVPDADILYACDFSWWEANGGAMNFQGLKLSVDKLCLRRPWNIKQVFLNKADDRLELIKFGTVGWGGNSGFHCLNLAVQFIPKKIVLIGLDMTLAHGIHWHGPHKKGLNNPKQGSVDRWRRVTDAAAPLIARLGIPVINASSISALQNYRKMSILEAIQC